MFSSSAVSADKPDAVLRLTMFLDICHCNPRLKLQLLSSRWSVSVNPLSATIVSQSEILSRPGIIGERRRFDRSMLAASSSLTSRFVILMLAFGTWRSLLVWGKGHGKNALILRGNVRRAGVLRLRSCSASRSSHSAQDDILTLGAHLFRPSSGDRPPF